MVAMLARFDLELIMASIVLHTLILPYRLPLTRSHLFLVTADHCQPWVSADLAATQGMFMGNASLHNEHY